MSATVEIRLHGRGGQGGVTCAKILAAAYSRLDRFVQTFGDYAGERSGAPVRAYTRVGDAPITNRNKVYEPDHLVVLDPTLLGPGAVAGLRRGGTLVLNTPEPCEAFAGRYDDFRLAVVDATAIARRRHIGTRSVVIVNTTIAGAFARAMDLDLDVLEAAYEDLGFHRDFEAAKEAWKAVHVREALTSSATARTGDPRPVVPLPVVPALTSVTESGPTGLRTGAWGTEVPRYVERLAPCSAACPAGNDVVGFVQAVARGDQVEAARVLGRSTPLAAVCGRVCPAPCMDGCNRRPLDGSVNVRALERYVADHAAVAATPPRPAASPRRVAVVGGGPAGLAAAHTLAREGHAPTVYDGEARLGGVLRTGIPTYRLPRDVLDREVDDVVRLGVDTRCGAFVDRAGVERLATEYDAVLVATGLQRSVALDIDGADLPGVEQGLAFLRRLSLGEEISLSGHVVVLGGGNTAIDCARSALRAGAERVTLAYRRTRREMPAIAEEVDEALEEGVLLLEKRSPLRFEGHGRVEAVVLQEVEMGPPDESGRRRPVPTNRIARHPATHVLLALGQAADVSLLPEGAEIRDHRVFVAGAPTRLFVAGDLATGDGTVTHAIGSGRRAAGLLLQALGEAVVPFERPDRRRVVGPDDVRTDAFARARPAREPLLPPAGRRTSFAEVRRGLGDAAEAERCFSCGSCTTCDTCLLSCPEGVIRRADEDGYALDPSYCKGCGLCVEECPRGAMEMVAKS